jgi:pentatricopeptide repeat protein
MEEADALAASLREYGSMDLHTYHTLMMGNTKLGRHQRVLVLYNEALDSSARLDGGIYSLAMLGALNCQLFQQVRPPPPSHIPPPHLFADMIPSYPLILASSQTFPQVPRIADKARAGGVQLTEARYTILIQAYAELGGIDQAVQCLDLMQSEGLRPNVITYAAAMAACRDRPTAVVQLLARMHSEAVTPNTIVLTSAINALARGGGEYTDRAYALMLDMEQNGPEPNIYTYNSIIRAFAEAGRLPEAMATLRSIELRGLKPDRYTFTTLLMACGRTNSSEPVEAIMETMKMAGIVPDEIAYGAAMDAHRRAGNSLKAVACLNEMRRYNLQPSAAHYNLVIRTLRAEGYVDKMFRMVMTMSLKEGVRVNGNTFELVIEALLETSKWKESLQLIRAMDKLEFRPSLQVCVQLVEVLEQAREYKAVLAMYKYMERQGYDFYENTILNGVFKRLVKVASLGARADLRKAAPLDSFLTEDALGLGLGEKADGKGDLLSTSMANQARPKGQIVQN